MRASSDQLTDNGMRRPRAWNSQRNYPSGFEREVITETSDALVVGGGPVGLFAALCLSERGMSVRVIDAEWERLARSYACGLHPETLRLLDELGLAARIVEGGHRVDSLGIYSGFEKIGSVRLDALPGAFAHVITLPQIDLEDALATALEERGVPILWRHEVTRLRLGDEYVEASATPKRVISSGDPESRYEQVSGAPTESRATYVVAADGFYSPCRTALGIDMNSIEEAAAFAIFEFTADLADVQYEAAIVLDRDSVSAFWPLGPTMGRWMFQVWERLDEPPRSDRLAALLHARVPWFYPTVKQVTWSTVTRFEHLIASQFGRDRVWLAGDAAHSTGPIGFQSMNRGFIEAYELATVMADVSRGNGHPSDAFTQFERRQQAEWQRLFGIQTRLVSRTGLSSSDGARLVPCLPGTGSDLDGLMTQLGLSFA